MIATLEQDTFTVWVPRASTRVYAYGSWGQREIEDKSRWFRFARSDGALLDMSDTKPWETLKPIALMASDAMEFGARRFGLDAPLKAYGLGPETGELHKHMERLLVEAGYENWNKPVGDL